MVNQSLAPRLLLTSLFLPGLSLPINNFLNLPIGTQERSWRLNGGYFLYLKKWGYRKSLCSGASQDPLRISSHLSPGKSLTWSARPCMIWSHHTFNLISYYCAQLTHPSHPGLLSVLLTCGHIPLQALRCSHSIAWNALPPPRYSNSLTSYNPILKFCFLSKAHFGLNRVPHPASEFIC